MTQETSGKYAKQNAIDLSPAASKWLTCLDEKVRPRHLPEQYPRIVNRMVELWQHPALMRTYFQELMVETRGNRAGFPDAVMVELGSLKHHYNRVLFPIKIDVWEKIWSKMDQDT
jgi:hypothetical protein